MIKKIFSIILAFLTVAFVLPAFASGTEYVALNETFENYAENATSASNVRFVSGIDGRVIKEHNGNKAAYTKAWGENGKIAADFSIPEGNEIVFSVSIMLKGAQTSGKLVSLVGAGSSLDLLTMQQSGGLILPGGKHIGGAPINRWVNYTFLINWEKGMMDVYIDGKCRVYKMYLPAGAYLSMNSAELAISEPEDGYTELMADNIRVYAGVRLPEEITFPAVTRNNEIEVFEETKTLNVTPTLFYGNDFKDGNGSISINSVGGKIIHKKENENGYINLYAGESINSKTYFDVSVPALSSESKYVVSVDFRINKLTGSSSVGIFDGKHEGSGDWRMGITLNAASAVDDTSYNQLFSYTQGDWHNLALSYNTGEGSCDVYFEGELFAESMSVNDISPTIFRIDILSSLGGVLDVDIDNIRFYKGRKPLSDEEYESLFGGNTESDESISGEASIVDYTSEAVSYLGSNIAFGLTNNNMYASGKKQSYPENYTPYVPGGVFMVTPAVLEAAGVDAVYNSADGTVSVLNGKIEMKVNSDVMKVGGKEIIMPTAVQEINGIPYIPLRSLFADALGKKLYYDERGFIVVSDGSFTYKNSTLPTEALEPIDSVYKYLQFDSPRSAQILSDIDKTIGDAHPRLLFKSSEINFILDRLESEDVAWKRAYKTVITNADKVINSVVPDNVGDDSKQYYSAVYTTNVEALATAYILTGDDKYAKVGVDNMLAACSWDSLERTTQLASGDWMLGTAHGFDAFYTYLLKHEKEFSFIKENIKRLAIEPVIKAYKGENAAFKWIKMTDNFNGFISGGAMMLCLAIVSEPEFRNDCGYLIENILKTMQLYVSIFEPDGAWYEGVSYGSYGLFHVADALIALQNCCGKTYSLTSGKGMKSAADWYIYSGTPQTSFTFHDMNADTLEKTWCGYYVAYLNGDKVRMEATKRFLALSNTSLPLRPLLYYEKAIGSAKPALDSLSLDHYFDSADTGTFYNSLESEQPTFAAFHGGWNGMPHDMLDLGCFMFVSDGVVWGYDMGSDNYALDDYFGYSGYKHYRKNTQGENVLTINPGVDRQNYWGQNTSAEAPLIKYETKARGAMAAYDLTDAYKRDVKSYKRGYLFGDDRNTLTVRDELKLKGKSEIYWAMHTKAEIEILDKNTAILKSGDKTLRAELVTNAGGYEFKSMDAELLPGSPGLNFGDGMKSTEGIRKLVVHLPEAEGEVNITVKLSPQNGRYNYTPVDGKAAIDKWQIPEGELLKPLSLEYLKVDGVDIEGFYPEKNKYTVSLPFGSERVPEITAQAKNGVATVIPAKSTLDKTIIRIEKEGYPAIECTVSFEVSNERDIKVSEALSGAQPKKGVSGELIVPQVATASHIDDAAHGTDHLFDNDFDTRCAAEGNCWFEIDFGEVISISGVAISFYDGDLRTQKYDILYSEDGINYKRVFSGTSLGTTTDYESIAAPGRARYIRFAGYGNSTSLWNSVTEFKAYR